MILLADSEKGIISSSNHHPHRRNAFSTELMIFQSLIFKIAPNLNLIRPVIM